MVGDGLVVKISDFGLSRENVVHTMSDGDKHITWKWLAPEVLLQGRKENTSGLRLKKKSDNLHVFKFVTCY